MAFDDYKEICDLGISDKDTVLGIAVSFFYLPWKWKELAVITWRDICFEKRRYEYYMTDGYEELVRGSRYTYGYGPTGNEFIYVDTRFAA